MNRFLFALLSIFIFNNFNIYAQAQGNISAREIGDVVFRNLDFNIGGITDVHGAIYVGHTIKTGMPSAAFFHELIEMAGVPKGGTSLKLLRGPAGEIYLDNIVTQAEGIGYENLASFSTMHSGYRGAFMHPSYPGIVIRRRILEKAQELMFRDDPISYIVVSGESFSDLSFKYFRYHETAGATLTDADIDRMRSDAFVEYCYAAAGRPILGDNITTRTGADALNSRGIGLLPSHQMEAMGASLTGNPVLKAYDNLTNELISDIAGTTDLRLELKDFQSGPGYVSIQRLQGGYPLGSAGVLSFDLKSPQGHILLDNIAEVQERNLSDFADITPGYSYQIRAYDHAGNYSDLSFQVAGYPTVSMESVSPLYYDFRGVSPIIPSTQERDHYFTFKDNTVGLSHVLMTGPAGTIMDWTFEPPVNLEDARLTGMAPGDYNIVVTNAAGNATMASFNIADLNVHVNIDGSRQVIDYSPDPLGPSSIVVRLKAVGEGSNDLDRIELLDSVGSVLDVKQLDGKNAEANFLLPSLVVSEPLFYIEPYRAPTPLFHGTLRLWDTKGNHKLTDIDLSMNYFGGVPMGAWTGMLLETPDFTASGSHKSEIFDIEEVPTPLLSGALVSDTYTNYEPGFSRLGVRFSGTATKEAGSGPITDKQFVGSISIRSYTSDSPDMSNAAQYMVEAGNLYAVKYDCEAGTAAGVIIGDLAAQVCIEGQVPQRPMIPVKRYIQIEAIFREASPSSFVNRLCLVPEVDENYQPTGRCTTGLVPEKWSFHKPGYLSGIAINSLEYPPGDPNQVIAGENVSLERLDGQVKIDFSKVLEPGSLSATLTASESPPGFVASPAGLAYEIGVGLLFAGTAKMTIKHDTNLLTAEQISMSRIVKVLDDPAGKYEILPTINNGDGTVSTNITGSGRFMVMFPEFQIPRTVSGSNLTFFSGEAVSLENYNTSSPEGQALLAMVKSYDRIPLGQIIRLGPDGVSFSPSGVVRMIYSDADVAALGIDEDSLEIHQFAADGSSFSRLPMQILDRETKELTARVPALSSLFAVTASSVQAEHISPTSYPDIVPPVTLISHEGETMGGATGLMISTATKIVFSAQDQYVGPNVQSSGNKLTNYLVSPQDEIVQLSTYTAPFALSEGVHSLFYFSVDNALNYEFVKSATYYVDGTAPRTELLWNLGDEVVYCGDTPCLGPSDELVLNAVDPVSGGVSSGVDFSALLIDVTPEECGGLEVLDPQAPLGTCLNPVYTGPFSMPPGPHTLYYFSVDKTGNFELANSTSVFVDDMPPEVTLYADGVEVSDGGEAFLLEGASVTLAAFDPVDDGFSTGIYETEYLIDVAFDSCPPEEEDGDGEEEGDGEEGEDGEDEEDDGPRGTCGYSGYEGPFTLTPGTHTVYYLAHDMVGNTSAVRTAYFTVTSSSGAAEASITPSSGPIGLPFTITGEGFGTYSAGTTLTLIGGATAPLTLWTDTQIKGTVPGSLAAGEYPVLVMRGSEVLAETSSFTVVVPALSDITPSSGPIGLPFALTGTGFGNYVASYTRVLIGGTTCPLTLWTDTQIKGTIPGTIAPGMHEVMVERELNGGLVRSATVMFDLRNMEADWIAPSSGPIGMPFTIAGSGFGNYVANYTTVLMGGATCPLTLWTDGQIKGTVPGGLATGQYPVLVERRTADGGVMHSPEMSFTVLAVDAASMTPVAGPIGIPFTIYGAGFGNYSAGWTRVLIGGTTAPLTLWSDTQIKGTMPGVLAAGTHEVIVERELNGGLIRSSALNFDVVTPSAQLITPSSGPIGLPFVLDGTGFGNYVANYTRVLIGGTTCPLTLWTDSQIKGTVPGTIAAGAHEVVVERQLNGGLVSSQALAFTLTVPDLAAIAKVLIGGTTAPLTLWTDGQIKGTVPGTIEPGMHEVLVERAFNGGVAHSQALSFELADPVLEGVSPSPAAVLSPFTLTGYNFGNYAAGKSEALIGGATAQLTLWTDTQIKGKLPALGEGDYLVLVRRSFNGGVSQSEVSTMTLVEPSVSSMTPLSGQPGGSFSVFGAFFGPYDAAIARVLIGGLPSSLSLWNDGRINGSVPAELGVGTHTVIVSRGQYQGDPLEFYVPDGGGYSPSFLSPLSPSAAFRLGAVYVYPNPAKGGVVPVFHLEFGLADKVELKVYSVAGTLVHERTLTGPPQVTSPVYAYEYAWEGHIASGVYYFTVEAERAGSKLKSRGKFAVVR